MRGNIRIGNSRREGEGARERERASKRERERERETEREAAREMNRECTWAWDRHSVNAAPHDMTTRKR